MKCLVWNCRGAKKSAASNHLLRLVRECKPNVVVLLETKMERDASSFLVRRLGRQWNAKDVPAVGLSGGIVVAWLEDQTDVEFVTIGRQLICGAIYPVDGPPWILGLVYASTSMVIRKQLWEAAKEVLSMQLSVVLIGDFNCILSPEDKYGGLPFAWDHSVRDFNGFITEEGLTDLGFLGTNYTWCNNQEGDSRILERLDRALATGDWLLRFPAATVQHLARIASDHYPLLLDVTGVQSSGGRPFRFEEFWAEYEAAWEIVREAWHFRCASTPPKKVEVLLKRTRTALSRWNREEVGNIFRKAEELEVKIQEVQRV